MLDVRQARVAIVGAKHRTEDMTGVLQALYTDPRGKLARNSGRWTVEIVRQAGFAAVVLTKDVPYSSGSELFPFQMFGRWQESELVRRLLAHERRER